MQGSTRELALELDAMVTARYSRVATVITRVPAHSVAGGPENYVRCAPMPALIHHLAVVPNCHLIVLPTVAWEFNSPPEFALLHEKSETRLQGAIDKFQQLCHGCHLAICVLDAWAEYIWNRLGMHNVGTVSNGSTPNLFRPDMPPVHCNQRNIQQLNVTWIDSHSIPWHHVTFLRDIPPTTSPSTALESGRLMWLYSAGHTDASAMALLERGVR